MAQTKTKRFKPSKSWTALPILARGAKLVPISRRRLELFSLIVLFGTTLLWGVLGAKLQGDNADQLVDSYLFENGYTFSGASFPKQHTFLLKWPLFWVQNFFGLHRTSFIMMTLAIVLLTVVGLVILLRRIESRPAVRSGLYLALASVLLLTPPVPYAGALLPTNLAMLTTRNIEYLFYIAGLILLARDALDSKRRFLYGTACLGIVFVSDGLFPALSIGGALVLFVTSLILKRAELRLFAQRWLGAGVVAYLAAAVLLQLFSWLAPDTINGRADPYRFINSLHDAALAIFYGFSALLTNFGANPAYGVQTSHDIPRGFIQELSSVGLIAYTVNIALFGLAILASYRLVRKTLFTNTKSHAERPEALPKATLLALALLASTIVAIVSFVMTDHYYVVDSRYLAIFLFSGFVSIAVYLRTKTISLNQVRIAVTLCCLAVASGCYVAVQTYQHAAQANALYNQRNNAVVRMLQNHKVTALVGDYWRVLPIKLDSQNRQNVTPLADCTTPRQTLTSTAWQPNLLNSSFAYLLTLDRTATNYPVCSLDQVIVKYGVPNANTVVSGSPDRPQELLLFYDRDSTLDRN